MTDSEEPGSSSGKPLHQNPCRVHADAQEPQVNWNYLTAVELNLNGWQMVFPRDKVLGGSSALNSLLWVRDAL